MQPQESKMFSSNNCRRKLTLSILILVIDLYISSFSSSSFRWIQEARAEDKQQVQHQPVGALNKPRNGYDFNRWDDIDDVEQERPVISENDIQSNPSRGLQISALKSQQEYVCGRAVANRRYKDVLLRDQSYQMSTTRTKYRPIEIRMPRIIGGDETAPGEFPWTVSVKLNGQPICGGSLIEKSWILTAAHCVVGYNPKNLTVRLGAYRIKDTSETQTIDSPISMFIIHKQYSMPRPFSNDIALLKMIEPVEYSDFIVPICLPSEDQAPSTTSNEIVTDYANLKSFSPTDTETGGIVVSITMTDKEISRCFKRLEQNYLNSIGLGTMSPSSDVVTSTIASATTPVSILLSPPLPLIAAAGAGPSPLLSSNPIAFDEHNSLDSISVTSQHNDNNKNNGGFNLVKDHLIFETINNHNSNNNNDKISFVSSQHQQAAQYFEMPMTNNDHHKNNYQQQQLQQHIYNQFNHANNQNQKNTHNNNYVYYGLPWNKRSNSQETGSRALDGRDGPMIKLTSLPINKELLREIQSVGSMSLNTLQQEDFVAMASDLAMTHGNADRERVTNSGGSNSRGQILRTTLMNDVSENINDASNSNSQYSGLAGTVVGWGWVRENDAEDQISNNNKGYPSVTLQKVKLPILRNNDCEAWFQSQSKKITLLPSQFCAGFNSGGKDACRVSIWVA